MLGNINRKGVFSLERPMTVIEGIAQAGGFVNSPAGQNSLIMADLSRSFLIRKDDTNGFEKLNVNFETLFLRGDLAQNVSLAPEDYLYFPPMDLQEVYVLGEVARPGVAVFTPEMKLMRAIVSRAGFTPDAFRQRVLVVRGSLNMPEKFVIDVNDILQAQRPDFKLEPRDIVYVSRKPWAFAEEIIEFGINEFIRAAVTAWTGEHVGPFIDKPFIK
jgi:protein involved in polysaccharide export with SLBB domain